MKYIEAEDITKSPYKELFKNALDNSTTTDYQQMMIWITTNLQKITTINSKHNSYSLKHIMERDIGLYTTNNVFKMGMLEAGFQFSVDSANWHYLDRNDVNLYFNVSGRSPIFKKIRRI